MADPGPLTVVGSNLFETTVGDDPQTYFAVADNPAAWYVDIPLTMTATVTLGAGLLGNPKLFMRVGATLPAE